MTSFLVDENIYAAAIQLLRSEGFDVKEVRAEELEDASDAALLHIAREESRTLVTFDSHFTNPLLYLDDDRAGVVRFRIHPPLLNDTLEALKHFLQQFDLTTLPGSLVVLERGGYRVRRTHPLGEQPNSDNPT